MAATLVQHVEAATGAALSQAVTLVHPASGNLLVMWVDSDNVINTPTDNGANTWTLGVSAVASNGAYVWWRVANSTDASTLTSITATAPSTATMHCGVMEWTGTAASPLDATATATTTCTAQPNTTSASVTTTGASGDLVLCFAMTWDERAGDPGVASWTNGFTNIVPSPDSSGGVTINDVATRIGWISQTGPGSISTVGSWSIIIAGQSPALMIGFILASVAAFVAPRDVMFNQAVQRAVWS